MIVYKDMSAFISIHAHHKQLCTTYIYIYTIYTYTTLYMYIPYLWRGWGPGIGWCRRGGGPREGDPQRH